MNLETRNNPRQVEVCRKKNVWTRKDEAKRYCARLQGIKMCKPYRCPVCGNWHISTVKK